jgi:predicted small lipoprotein YifL
VNAALPGAVLATLLLAGCGQKGPLHLPDQTGEVVTRPTQTPETPPAEEPPPPPEDEDDEGGTPPQT